LTGRERCANQIAGRITDAEKVATACSIRRADGNEHGRTNFGFVRTIANLYSIEGGIHARIGAWPRILL
jgi:hypothetical protein